jgi:hypothetical protein
MAGNVCLPTRLASTAFTENKPDDVVAASLSGPPRLHSSSESARGLSPALPSRGLSRSTLLLQARFRV